jgi:hypothetical protein
MVADLLPSPRYSKKASLSLSDGLMLPQEQRALRPVRSISALAITVQVQMAQLGIGGSYLIPLEEVQTALAAWPQAIIG